MTSTKEELLEQWMLVEEPNRREEIFNELVSKNLFPDDKDYDVEYGLYPSITDKNFLMKLFHKREFAENKYDSIEDLATCKGDVEFELSPVQRFVSTYLSGKTPYYSALLYHGVGVGKTCAAIASAEAYLYSYSKQKVFIVAPPNIQPNFVRTIFDIHNVNIGDNDLPNIHRGCTGNLYLELTGTEYERDLKVIERKVKKLINSRYMFMGYIQLASYIEDIVEKVSYVIRDPERRRFEEIKAIRKEFTGRCMIIDEAHNLRDVPGEKEEDNLNAPGGDIELTDAAQGKRLTPTLIRVLTYANNMKLILLTATPMYNSYLEIIFLLNLLLQNDKRAPLKQTDIFDKQGNFTKEGTVKFGNVVKAYVSYMRGETPISFPIRLDPKNVATLKGVWPSTDPSNKKIQLTEVELERLLKLPIVPVTYGEETYQTYSNIIHSSSGLGISTIDTLVQSGNWIYPAIDESVDINSRIRDSGFDNSFDDRTHSIKNFTRFSSKLGSPSWLIDRELINYSPKAAFIIKRIRTTKGPVFVYSRFIKSGALPFALALEANGYTLHGRGGTGLLVKSEELIRLHGGRQCALCEYREMRHVDSDHEFVPAKYVILTGRKDISPNNTEAINSERKSTNYNGADIKVVIGSQVASEGIDLKFIREIYVFDSWFHLNKMEQVLGRGIRTCSHIHQNIPEDERNCTIYLMVNKLKDERETADLYMYRLGMLKALQMGNVTRVIKRYALDCNLNIDVNIIHGLPISEQTDAQGNTYSININDQNYTNMCDWMECKYTCAEPVEINLEKTSTLTYDEYDAKWREFQIKNVIRTLFETSQDNDELMMIRMDQLTEIFSMIPEEALFSILYDIVNNKTFRLVVNNKEGYLTYTNGFFLFQPIKISYDDIPLAFRIADYPIKVDSFVPIKVEPQVEILDTQEDLQYVEVFWETMKSFTAKIQNGTLESMPSSVVDIIRKKYDNEKKVAELFISFDVILWIYNKMKDSIENRKILGYAVLEYIWDTLFNSNEQVQLLKLIDNVLKKVAEEQIIQDGKYFRYMNTNEPYDIKYMCGTAPCAESIVKDVIEVDTSDKYLTVPEASTASAGKFYGFMVPKMKTLIFKTNIPEPPGKVPKGGQECKNISSIKGHLDMIYEMGTILKQAEGNEFQLNEQHLGTSAGKNRLKNANSLCTLKELMLRWMDIKGVRSKRWFYRPIASYKTNHRGKITKQK